MARAETAQLQHEQHSTHQIKSYSDYSSLIRTKPKSTQTTTLYLELIPTSTQNAVVYSALIPKSTRYSSLPKLQYFLSAPTPKPVISDPSSHTILTNIQLPSPTHFPVTQLAISQNTPASPIKAQCQYCTVLPSPRDLYKPHSPGYNTLHY